LLTAGREIVNQKEKLVLHAEVDNQHYSNPSCPRIVTSVYYNKNPEAKQQIKAKQSKAKQNKTKQSKSKVIT
jgi:hypothetical protein